MLDFIRNRAQSWVAWIIVGFIILTFALWGVSNYLMGGGDAPIAEVNGLAVSQAELQNSYQRQRQQMQQLLGDNFSAEMFPEQQMKQRVLEGLIERNLILSAAMDAGYRIGDRSLVDYLRSIPQFQKDGQFSTAAYEQSLRMQGYLPGNFENILRRDLIAQQFVDSYLKGEFVTAKEAAEHLRLSSQLRRIDYLVFPTANFAPGIVISDEEIGKAYANNGQRYAIPEQVTIDYLELDAAEIARNEPVDESELLSRYESQKEMNYRSSEERRARHILVTLEDDAADAQLLAANEKIAAIQGRLAAGESFADLAKTESDDSGSASQGGDLGFFGKGIMDAAFEKAAFSLQQGEISGPVRSAFGIHLIKLDEVRGGEVKPFEQVREVLRAEIVKERAEQRFFDQAEMLTNLTYEQPDTLQVAASELGLSIKRLGPFSRRDGSGIAADPKVVAAAFSDDVLNGKNNSSPIELAADHVVVLRVATHIPSTIRPLEEVRASIVAELTERQALATANTEVGALLEEIRQGGSAATIAKRTGVALHHTELFDRRDQAIDPRLVQEAFRSPRPADATRPIWRHVTNSRGEQALLAVVEVQDGSAVGVDGGAATEAVSQSINDLVYGALLASLRSHADIEVKQ